MCLRLPFAPGISQAWDSTQVPRHGRPHQVNRRSRERQVQRGSSGSLGRLPFHSSSPPFCDAVRCLVVGLRLFSPLSSPFTLGLLTELRSFGAPGPHRPGFITALLLWARAWSPVCACARKPAALAPVECGSL